MAQEQPSSTEVDVVIRAKIEGLLIPAEQYVFALVYSAMNPGQNRPLEAARSNLIGKIIEALKEINAS